MFSSTSLQANTDQAGRPHVKFTGVRSPVITEGYHHLTLYFLLFLVSLSILVMVASVGDFVNLISSTSRKCIEDPNIGGSALQLTMCRIHSGFFDSLTLSVCGVMGVETVRN